MIIALRHIMPYLVAAIIIAFLPAAASAREPLITSITQLTPYYESSLGNLGESFLGESVKEGSTPLFLHASTDAVAKPPQLEVTLKSDLTLAANESLVLRIGRHDNKTTLSTTDGNKAENDTVAEEKRHPIAFTVYGKSSTDTEWGEPLGHLYLLYRGNRTIEYSERLHFDKKVDRLLFVCTATNDKTADCQIGTFNIIRLTNDETYSDFLEDRFHFKSDYVTEYRDYTFEHTLGLLNENNHIADFYSDDCWKDMRADPVSPGWKWDKDLAFLSKAGIRIPAFSPIIPDCDSNRKVTTFRQPTHVMEHELYAIPGDAIALYPFYKMPEKGNTKYEENFSHWYNYRTGGNVTYGNGHRLLDFLIDPAYVVKSDTYGYFGIHSAVLHQEKTIFISTPQEWNEFAEMVNKGYGRYNAILTADLDFTGVTPVMIGIYSADNSVDVGKYFGHFDGKGHRISNYTMSGDNGVGVFANLGNGAIVENLIFDKTCSLTGKERVGLIATSNAGAPGNSVDIRNIVCAASLTGTRNVGGILGCAVGTSHIVRMRNCVFAGAIHKGTVTKDGKEVSEIRESGLITGWMSDRTSSEAVNIISIGTIDHHPDPYVDETGKQQNGDSYFIRKRSEMKLSNCYSTEFNESLEGKFTTKIIVNEGGSFTVAEKTYENGAMMLGKIFDMTWLWDDGMPVPPMPKKSIRIATVGDYKDFMTRVNNGDTGLKADLLADLDFSGVEGIVPVGTATNRYTGTFDGHGHVISNLTINQSGTGVGMFGTLYQGAVIKNFAVIDASISGSAKVGLIGDILLNNNEDHSKEVVLSKLFFKGEITASGKNAGGILGCNTRDNLSPVNNIKVTITECGVEGKVTGNGGESGIISGWMGSDTDEETKCLVENCYAIVDFAGGRNSKNNYAPGNNRDIKNCYARNENIESSVTWKDEFMKDGSPDYEKLAAALGSQWSVQQRTVGDGTMTLLLPFTEETDVPEDPDPVPESGPKISEHETRYYGTVATFFCPHSINVSENKDGTPSLPADPSAPEDSTDKDFIIAADFSQKFDMKNNLDADNKKIIEPVITFRHIFRIKDGIKQAEEFSGSPVKNKEYVKKHRRIISAPANKEFQIRLDCPVPVRSKVRSKYYYKISDKDYRRICSSMIRVTDLDTGDKSEIKFENIGDANQKFYFGETFNGEGSRTIDGVEYRICGGGGSYYRMLKCPASTATPGKRYLVQTIALDVNKNPLKPFNATDNDDYLIVQEFEISFLVPEHASVLPESELGKGIYADITKTRLVERFGEPKAKVNFDEYRHLEKAGDGTNTGVLNPADYLVSKQENTDKSDGVPEGRYYKWPVEWENSSCGFGYNKSYDYNMYRIANHSSMVRYRDAAFSENSSTKGLYDRLYYETGGKDRGYFYYVNAAGDPGVMARLPLEDLCEGSTIHVSAWVAEFSKQNETANLTFNFTARTADGERILIHSFTTGYTGTANAGKWMHVYYQFVPDISALENKAVIQYEMELDNNCKNSQGADYAIDAIRLYVVRPQVFARQLEPVCTMQDTLSKVRIELSFEALLSSLGIQEYSPVRTASEEVPATGSDAAQDREAVEKTNVHIEYTFLDKEIYETTLNENKDSEDRYRMAFEAAQLKYNYSGTDVTGYGTLHFSNKYDDNESYPEDETSADLNKAYRHISSGDRLISFLTQPLTKEQLKPGKEYIIAIYLCPEDAADKKQVNDYDRFAPADACAKTGLFRVVGANTVKIDGVPYSGENDLVVCQGERPKVTATLKGRNQSTGKTEDLDENALFDWYAGSEAEYETIKAQEADIAEGDTGEIPFLQEALMKLRESYPDATSCDGVTPKNGLTQTMINLIKRLMQEKHPADGRPMLTLLTNIYEFMPVKRNGTDSMTYVTAIPAIADGIKTVGTTNYIICTAPLEIGLKVNDVVPSMMHGFDGITYPADPYDAPLRLTLDQIWMTAEVRTEAKTEAKTMMVPLVRIVCPSEHSDHLAIADNDGEDITLVSTDDPDFNDKKDIPRAGTLCMLEAWKGDASIGKTNAFYAAFNKDFPFREGYTYRLRFSFREASLQTAEAQEGCPGYHEFEIKVVPKYLNFTPQDGDINWNNDRNWSRVSAGDLLDDGDSSINREDHTTPGTNTRIEAFMPGDYTSVIINGNQPDPRLYAFGTKTPVAGYDWDNPADNPAPDGYGSPTDGIQFDMVGINAADIPDAVKPEDANVTVGLRPWYANHCDGIHFNAGSEMLGQQHLVYNKAWADMEITSQSWHTLSSPLKDVVAGDMYLPTKGGRQATELFRDITFDTKNYHRFRPAVYQRSWNKATATVYEIKDGPKRNVAVEAAWSHVFNDVEESYAAGTGFSIKVDDSGITDKPESGKALFRLPKADTEYLYYNTDNSEYGNSTKIPRTANNRLNDTNGSITVSSAKAGKYFLVGNPFMSRLDMRKFLESNTETINPKFWVMDGSDTQTAAVLDPRTALFISTAGILTDEETSVMPMQGFFVEAKEDTQSLTLTYDEDMMAVYNTPSALKAPAAIGSRAGNDAGSLPAMLLEGRSGSVLSHAVIYAEPGATKGYDEAEDAALLMDRDSGPAAYVYTVAGDRAVSINMLDDADGTEIGVVAPDDALTELSFHGTEAFGAMSLLDTRTGTSTPLAEGMTLEVKGPASGRFFLIGDSAMPANALLGLRLSADGNTVTVTAPAAHTAISVTVFTTDGMTVKSVECSGKATFRLDDGVYVIKATASDGTSLRRKLMIG